MNRRDLLALLSAAAAASALPSVSTAGDDKISTALRLAQDVRALKVPEIDMRGFFRTEKLRFLDLYRDGRGDEFMFLDTPQEIWQRSDEGQTYQSTMSSLFDYLTENFEPGSFAESEAMFKGITQDEAVKLSDDELRSLAEGIVPIAIIRGIMLGPNGRVIGFSTPGFERFAQHYRDTLMGPIDTSSAITEPENRWKSGWDGLKALASEPGTTMDERWRCYTLRMPPESVGRVWIGKELAVMRRIMGSDEAAFWAADYRETHNAYLKMGFERPADELRDVVDVLAAFDIEDAGEAVMPLAVYHRFVAEGAFADDQSEEFEEADDDYPFPFLVHPVRRSVIDRRVRVIPGADALPDDAEAVVIFHYYDAEDSDQIGPIEIPIAA